MVRISAYQNSIATPNSLVPNTKVTIGDSDCPKITAEFETQRITPLTK